MARQQVVVALLLLATVGLAFAADAASPAAATKPDLLTFAGVLLLLAVPLVAPVLVLPMLLLLVVPTALPPALLVDLSLIQLSAPLPVVMPRVLMLALPPLDTSQRE
ncbi:anther-specific protein BCP1-like [Pyrus ussuriensis x Pyrus communis]|uniref:Anther-specific protein BCP1-like n=1 Tax=Pyrus ussuriensis x Pyrus communis TaxID=2448454 RepID=A0A5N5G373_9ROSA|nr:anther-specific protein BCP1-like [Pyrus ussuriensis x Pyrus communis]